MAFYWIQSAYNLSDMLSKHWDHPTVYPMILKLLITRGNINLMIQFPPEMDENWVRYGLAKLGQISRLPNWQRMLFCAYTTQLLHSTGEVCWNNKDSYFIWFEFCVQKLRTDSFQEVLEAVLFGVGVYLQMLTVGSLVGAQLG